MQKIILIKYGELGTKKGNIKVFINKLISNIKKAFVNMDVVIDKEHLRLFVHYNEIDENTVIEKLSCIPGIQSFVIATKCSLDIEEINEYALNLATSNDYKTFKVDVRRGNKKFEFDSPTLNYMVGSHILRNTENLKVDVKNPELHIKIEIREDYAAIYNLNNEIKGLGGYPIGTLEKGMVMISGGIDSPVASYLCMKRGMELNFLYFESLPHTSLKARQKVLDILKVLSKYDSNIKLTIVPFTKMQEEIYKNVVDTYQITILRRMMYKIADKYARLNNIKVLINGESVGQVASQTISSMNVINEVTNLPILRPVCTYDKLEIIDIAKKIGTYEVSIRPYEDCCTIFVPKNPVIKPILSKCTLYEESFDYSSIIEEIIPNIFEIDINNNEFDDLF